NAAADGYTLLVSNFATNLANKYSFKNLRYDPLAFENVGMMARNTMFVVVSANSRFKSFKDLIAAGRERQLSYASNGYGSPPHLAAELLGKSARLKLLHIPYKGSTESYADLRSGRVDFAFDGGTAKPMIDAGALRMLAVTVPERWPLMPDVPTMIEEGAPGAAVATFFGLVAPKGTPAAILDKLSAALLAANADPAVLKQLPPLGMVPFTANRAQTASFFTAERAKWKPVIESSGIQLD
ncbi:MAG: tripartite tricarboxylate transporter substrate binding protein, partial [Desulfobacterales bacterium]|nr:tripartite tricarboxylate transporter substrate binding protein [Desulfobacterales bacterium]